MTELVACGRPPAVQLSPVLFVGETTSSGTVLSTSRGRGAEWADQVVASLGPGERAVVVLPFRPDVPGIAHRVALGRPPESGPVPPRTPGARHHVTERPTASGYAQRVRTALRWIEAGRLHKVVLGRSVEVRSDPPLDADPIVARLLAARPGRYVFKVPLSSDPDGPVVLGASPELLVGRHGRAVRSLPLAGSVPRSTEAVEDAQRIGALLSSAKDRREHVFVVEPIVAALALVCDEVFADDPRIVSTDTLHHLGTSVAGTLTGTAIPSALHLAQLLHPTPAIGGAPTAAALRAIDDLEEDRGPLTGVVGWVDGDGDGEFAITIRAGVLDRDRLRLYAGAGIVAGSDPDAEVRETGAKLSTMLKAVGL
ncbi:MAG: isochorismate synthase [Micropruina sp.]